EHLDEIRAGDGEERHAGLAGDRAGEQGLAGSGRPDQQDAFGNPTPQLLELLGLPEELDDLLKLFFGFLDASDILECHLLLLRGVETCTALAKTQRLIPAALH